MKKKLLLFIICIILLVSLLSGIVFAADLVSLSDWNLSEDYYVYYGHGEKTSYSLDKLINMYKSSGAEYKKIELNYQLNDLYLSQLDTQLSFQDDAINQYRQLISQNKQQISNYQNEMSYLTESSEEWITAKSNLDASLANSISYKANLDNLIIQKADIYVQRENYKFIKENKDLLQYQDYMKQIADFKEKCLYLIVLKENKNLADSSVEYSNLLYQISKANLDKGRATQTDVDFQEVELLIGNNERDSTISSYNNSFKSILRMVGIDDNKNVKVNFDIKGLRQHKLIEYKTAESSFRQNDIKAKQLENNILVIDEKINILSDVYDDQSSTIAIEKKKKEISMVELETYLFDRSSSFNNLYSDYESKYDEVNLKEKKVAAQNKKYTIALNKFNLGLISRIELQEARIQLRQSELDAWVAFLNYIKAHNAIKFAMMGLL